MPTDRVFTYAAWTLSLGTIVAALAVWWPSAHNLTTYSLFPLFGLIAFGLMWAHYVIGALQHYLKMPDTMLGGHFRVTGYIVLFCIVVHPLLLQLQLYLDGFGLPPQSLLTAYPGIASQLAVFAGIAALACFLMFEFYRLYEKASWWKYVERANIVAMILILGHGFVLGDSLRAGWFQVVWLMYAVTFVMAVTYTGYYKRRNHHARNREF